MRAVKPVILTSQRGSAIVFMKFLPKLLFIKLNPFPPDLHDHIVQAPFKILLHKLDELDELAKSGFSPKLTTVSNCFSLGPDSDWIYTLMH